MYGHQSTPSFTRLTRAPGVEQLLESDPTRSHRAQSAYLVSPNANRATARFAIAAGLPLAGTAAVTTIAEGVLAGRSPAPLVSIALYVPIDVRMFQVLINSDSLGLPFYTINAALGEREMSIFLVA